MSDKGPVIVTLTCEANPSTEDVEIDRVEWEAMSPGERLALIQDLADNHVTNSGGYGWFVDDEEDLAAVGDRAPDPLRELAEWIVRAGQNVTNDQIITRARKALGKEG